MTTLLLVIIALLLIPLTMTTAFAQNTAIVLSPFKQFKVGIPLQNISCNQGLVLFLKISDGYPVCVKSTTAEKFIARGWAYLCNKQSGLNIILLSANKLLGISIGFKHMDLMLGVVPYQNLTSSKNFSNNKELR